MMNKRNVGKSSFQISRQNLHTSGKLHPPVMSNRERNSVAERSEKNIKYVGFSSTFNFSDWYCLFRLWHVSAYYVYFWYEEFFIEIYANENFSFFHFPSMMRIRLLFYQQSSLLKKDNIKSSRKTLLVQVNKAVI